MAEIAVALGGGGVKGIAHVGVLRRLIEEGFEIKSVAGTSIGGLIGAIFCAGFSPDEIVQIINKLDDSTIFARRAEDGPSVMGLAGLSKMLSENLGEVTFDELKIPFACTAVDINMDQEVILSRGKVMEAVLATIAIPGIFPPVEMGGAMLVDGGVLDPVPVGLARWLSPTLPVIAVVLSPLPMEWKHLPTMQLPSPIPLVAPLIEQFSRLRIGKAINIFTRSFDITSRMLTELRLKADRPEVIIRPDVGKFGILDRVKADDLIILGEQAADQAIPDIQQALRWPNQIARQFRKAELPNDVVKNFNDDNQEV